MLARKREPSYTVVGSVNWYSHYGNQCGVSSKKLEIELPYDLAIPLIVTYLKKNENTSSKRYMDPNVLSSIIHNCQDMEAI